MHIKELVLDDFKSFGRKTRIPFYEDFTVVTGPNGSGKSNIIDAVLFALGLARTRGIRAEKLTDLIYNPGYDEDEDGPSGPREASVTVVLDNSDGRLDRSQITSAAGTDDVGDVDEISIKRRVKETEENYYSYYYLNGRSGPTSSSSGRATTPDRCPNWANAPGSASPSSASAASPRPKSGSPRPTGSSRRRRRESARPSTSTRTPTSSSRRTTSSTTASRSTNCSRRRSPTSA